MSHQYNPTVNVDDLTDRLDQMNVQPEQTAQSGRLAYGNNRRQLESQDSSDSGGYSYDNNKNEQRMSLDEEAAGGNILIVTNLDPAIFSDALMKAKFESLFSYYDERVTVRYLKSFRRVRLDFRSAERAKMAKNDLTNYMLGSKAFKCFIAQIIRPRYDKNARDSQDQRVQRVHGPETDDEDDDYYNDHLPDQRRQQHLGQREGYVKKGYLNIPKLTRQYLISPPMSPPEDWRPKEESEPCIDVQLLAAIANLVPGQTHELHAGTESQPGIVVEVCEEPYFDTTSKLSCRNRLPKTAIPGTPRPEPADEEAMES